MHIFRTVLTAVSILTTSFVQAGEPMESDWLELVKGYKGSTMGAEIMEVEEGEDDGMRKVTIAIPKTSIGNPDEIEEVVVVGRKPEEPEKPEPMNIEFEWVDDYDKDNYGLVIRLGEGNWPIRLFMNSDAGFTR